MEHSAQMHLEEALNLREVIVFLIIAGLLVPVVQRYRISPVLGFIVTGLLIGPYGLGRFVESAPWLSYIVIQDADGVRTIAELGVVFLLFMIGLELSVDRLMSMRKLVFGLGGSQVILTAIVITAIAAAFGNSTQAAILIGASLALSSTAIVMQLLIEQRRFGTPTGQTAFSILLFQDLAVVPILFLAGVFGEKPEHGIAIDLGIALLKAVGVIAAIFLLGRLIVRPVFRFVGATQSRELFMAMVLLAIIGTAILTAEAGLSLALGAFLAGLLLAETEYRHQVEVDIEPFKGLLLGLFFLSVGMSLDLSALLNDPVRIIASVIGLLAIKSAIIYTLARAFRTSRPIAAETAILLGQGGEFAFVVLSLALASGTVPPDVVQFILLVTILSMLLTPLLARLAQATASALRAEDAPDAELSDIPDGSDILKNHVVIAGYGRVGQLLGNVLDEQCIPHVAIDTDPATVTRHRKAGAAVYYGDATHTELLAKLELANAAALVITVNDHRSSARMISAVRQRWPEVPILSRARDVTCGKTLIATGASAVVPETTEASLDLAEVVFSKLGIASETARQIIAERRRLERNELMSE